MRSFSFSEFQEVLWLSVAMCCFGGSRWKSSSVQPGQWRHRRRESWEKVSHAPLLNTVHALWLNCILAFFSAAVNIEKSLLTAPVLQLISHCSCDSWLFVTEGLIWKHENNVPYQTPWYYTANISAWIHCLPTLHKKYNPASAFILKSKRQSGYKCF